MAVGKEIRTQIGSIKNTQKITSAMQLVAASKMRKAQERMGANRPYADRILEVIGHLAYANPEYNHLYLDEREMKRVGYIVVSTDRGLCGGLNANLFKKVVAELGTHHGNGVEVDLAVIGSKAIAFDPITAKSTSTPFPWWVPSSATTFLNRFAFNPPHSPRSVDTTI